jgi:RNA polymerase sigma-B factor
LRSNAGEQASADRFTEYAATRDPALRDALVLEHLPLVEKLARRYTTLGEPLEDLLQEGYIGLIKAVDQFNPKMGVKFTTYATHVISGEIRHYLRDLGRLIKEPAWLIELRFRVNRAAEELSQRLGRLPSAGEIAEELGIPEEDVAEVVTTRAIFQVASLDESPPADEEDDSAAAISEKIADTRQQLALPLEERMVLRQAVRKLRKLERSVIYHFFYQEHTKTEIARKLDISVNYVSYLIGRGLMHLKQMLIRDERCEALHWLEFMEKQLSASEDGFDKSAIIDAVTGLYNRAFFVRLIYDEVARAKRYEIEFSLIVMLIKEWHELAERMTEREKEKLLRRLAELLKRSLRDVDRISYCGQGRFGAILPHTGASAEVASKRILTELKSYDLRPPRLKSFPQPHVVCKIYLFPKEATSAEELIALLEKPER